MSSKSNIFLPPLMRFVMELTAWGYFLILAFTIHLVYILGFLLSAVLLGVFNFPGDKKIDGPVNIPGWLRILNEWFSGGLLSIVAGYILFQELGVILQVIILILVIILDRERYKWMLGYVDTPPVYVTAIRKN